MGTRLTGEQARRGRLLAGLKGLAGGEPIEFRVVGRCMEPIARHGARVKVAPSAVYWPGDLVAFRVADGRILLHRSLGYLPVGRRLRLITQADSRPSPDPSVPLERILGRVRGGDCSPAAIRPPLPHRLRALLSLFRFAWRKLRST